ncbi:GTPase Era involved in 16S rRNA processing [Arthrobacter sp. PvP102]|uniref:GTPase n=1 Tax=unclassified Arthrobacter TaxID=235627 RepID=UPI00005269C2|nr:MULTISPECIES: GTPase [unclassified Arthrobacter]ABK03901.1 putative ABC transporter [Arthrobacter sp. FB24]MBP1231827.1 GTPase Era involved in 16S rRNA processing [Arthrobacter sp. PvP103]MBP1236962.1 GTPase Era involved in 16S rRNA processing [Arthrobacter sp. PvP102]
MSRHSGSREASRLDARLQALNDARELAGGVLPDEALDDVLQVLERASSRRSLSAEHTVVGFFGATGSGKSSLFNAVSGAEIATAAVRRPTTSEPLAGVWGQEGSEPLLDWLGVAKRHHSSALPGFADESTGLILLDLPDFDSTKAANREIVQRMVGLVDVLVWVLDPQKYADAAVHNDFLAPLASHGAVTLVVLNQVDRLPPSDIGPVLESLKAILARDGLGKVQVLGASALDGTGVDKVRAAIRDVVVQRQASSQRLAADVSKATARLAAASGTGEAAGVKAGTRSRLADELAAAANVPLVADAVSRSYRQEATRRTGWPLTRWLVRFRPDPLRRLNLRREGAAAEVNRTSLPPAGAPERARTDAAVREFADAASAGAPGPWRAAIRGAAREGRDQLPDAMDQAIAGTELLAGRKSWWWGLFNVAQWLALVAVLGGVGWLGVLAGLGYLQLPVPEVPRVEGWPVPTLMIAGGLLLGVVLALAGKAIAGAAARVRGGAAGKKLRAAVAAVADRRVVEPVEVEVSRLKSFNAALKAAGRD